jgi:hypothetical protein
MPELVTFDENNRIFRVCLYKAADGTPLTGLTFESTGLIVSTIADVEATATAYPRVTDKIETITTLGTYAAPTATKCRFKEVDATNHPGLYEIQLADARLSVASAKSLLVTLSGYSTLAVCNKLIPLTRLDLQAATVTLANGAHGGAAASLNLAGGTAFGNTTMGTLTQTGAVSWGATTFAALTVTAATTLTGAVVLTDQTTALSLGKYLADILGYADCLPASWVTVPAASAVADAVWDEAQSGHTGAGSFGLYVDAKVSEAGGGGLTAADIADAVWNELATGHVDAGKAGAQLWTVINTLSSGSAINVTTTTTVIESE